MGLRGTNTLSRYEHGKKLPSLINALKLEIVYRTPVAFLFSGLYDRLKKEVKDREEKLGFGKDKKSEKRKKSPRIKNDLFTYRKKMGLPQRRVAYLMGLKGTNSLSRYEHGKKLPSLENALRLEIIYHVPVAFLFGELYEELKREIRKREGEVKS